MIYTVFQTFCVFIFANITEIFSLFEHVEQNFLRRLFYLVFRGDKNVRRKQRHILQVLDSRTVDVVERLEFFNLIVPEYYSERCLTISGENIDSVAFHTETASCKLNVVAVIQRIGQLEKQVVTTYLLPDFEIYHVFAEIFRVSDAVNT